VCAANGHSSTRADQGPTDKAEWTDTDT
jgi:hypothetical protein